MLVNDVCRGLHEDGAGDGTRPAANQAATPEGLNTEQTERMMTKNSGLAAAVLYVRHAWL
jgi:hypothetical protein